MAICFIYRIKNTFPLLASASKYAIILAYTYNIYNNICLILYKLMFVAR